MAQPQKPAYQNSELAGYILLKKTYKAKKV